jgi:tetratricopeptide (TPR) repeat protein
MRAVSSATMRANARRGLALAAAWALCACAGPGATRPEHIQTDGAGGGFTITQHVRVGADVRAKFEDAVRLLEQEDYQRAISLLVEVTEAAPDAIAAQIDLGMAYERVNDLEHAKASLERALEIDPRHPVVYNELGIVYRRMGRFAEARQSYEKALALYPQFHFARRNLAILCDLFLADASCAIQHYELYLQAVPDDKTAAMWVADLRARAGK